MTRIQNSHKKHIIFIYLSKRKSKNQYLHDKLRLTLKIKI